MGHCYMLHQEFNLQLVNHGHVDRQLINIGTFPGVMDAPWFVLHRDLLSTIFNAQPLLHLEL
jgi:hypothetical protein